MNRLAQVSIILQKHILEIIKQEKTSWSELTKTSLKNFLSSSQNSEKSTMEEINEKTIFDIYTKKVNESNSERFGNEMFSKKGKNNKKGLGFITPQASPMRVFNSLGCKDVGECSSKNNEQNVASNKLYKNSRSLAIIWFFAEKTLKPIISNKFDAKLNIEAKNIINSLEFDPKILKNKWVEGWEDDMADENQKLFWKETIILGLRVLTAFERMKKIYELKGFATTVIGRNNEFTFETLENEEKLIEDISEELEEAVLKKTC
uniref:Uncharacterized protein n=1 Tax=Meloidogyne floridensis TaxID=298350 RepID=A0A915PCF9_9BILA